MVIERETSKTQHRKRQKPASLLAHICSCWWLPSQQVFQNQPSLCFSQIINWILLEKKKLRRQGGKNPNKEEILKQRIKLKKKQKWRM